MTEMDHSKEELSVRCAKKILLLEKGNDSIIHHQTLLDSTNGALGFSLKVGKMKCTRS